MTGQNLQRNLETFLRHIDAINETLPMTELMIKPFNLAAKIEFIKFVKNNTKIIQDDNGEEHILVKADESKIFEKLERKPTKKFSKKIIQ